MDPTTASATNPFDIVWSKGLFRNHDPPAPEIAQATVEDNKKVRMLRNWLFIVQPNLFYIDPQRPNLLEQEKS
jgi:hypothetical protein